MKVVALAGGVGGAKLAHGLTQVIPAEDLTLIVNTGDDFEHFGLSICPDLDTVCYTLAGLANPNTGWGRADETWNVQQSLAALDAPAWFSLGDRDLATHLERTRRLQAGEALSAITAGFCAAWGVPVTVLPMSDQPVRTMVDSDEGELAFQHYFVRRACQPKVKGFRFSGLEAAKPAPGVLGAINAAQLIIICPSNPWVSIAPILALGEVRAALAGQPIVAVSPIIAGKAVKGPAAKMFAELGITPSALAVARYYGSLLSGLVIDLVDVGQAEGVRELGIIPLVTATLMEDRAGRTRLAAEVLEFGKSLL
ncbi:MAG: 2-phospho-L-lactate transferase [Anaerolineales bacterium]